LREQLDVDDLLEQLAPPLDRLVSEPVELIHALERGGVVAQRDRAIAHLGDRARGLLRSEAPGSSGGVRVARLVLERLLVAARESNAPSALPLRPAAGSPGAVSTRDDSVAPPPPPSSSGLRYARVVLKLSGEALCGADGGFGIHPETLKTMAGELAEVHGLGVQ